MKLSNISSLVNMNTIIGWYSANDKKNYEYLSMYINTQESENSANIVLTTFQKFSSFRKLFDYTNEQNLLLIQTLKGDNSQILNVVTTQFSDYFYNVKFVEEDEDEYVETDEDRERDLWNTPNYVSDLITARYGKVNSYRGSADWGGIPVWSVGGSDLFEGFFIGIDDNDEVFFLERNLTDEETIDTQLYLATNTTELNELFDFVDDYVTNNKHIYLDQFVSGGGSFEISGNDYGLEDDEDFEEVDELDEINDFLKINSGSFIFKNNENKNVLGDFNYDSSENKLIFNGKISGGKKLELYLNVREAQELINSRIDVVDADALNFNTEMQAKLKNYWKEYKTDFELKFKTNNYLNPKNGYVRDEDEEKFKLLKNFVGYNQEVWKYLSTNSNMDEFKFESEDIDSRFSNEREGYVGMYSGDLRVLVKLTMYWKGKKYQKITNERHDTNGFF